MTIAALLALSIALTCCRGPGGRSQSSSNVLLITLDTTRADHLGCYGFEAANTPHIDQLAEKGVRFENAVCQSPLTLPSHASILTGTYPLFHGVRDNGGFYLEERYSTLAELLHDRGYATSAFVGAFVLDSRWGLGQGFETYDDEFGPATQRAVSLDAVQRRGNEVVDGFLTWLDTRAEKPFFSWIHFYDPHTPYDPPEPFRSDFSGARRSLYDGEIAYVDSLIGRVAEELRERALLEETLMVIVGDHGESLGEHQENGHGLFVYDGTVRVPLILCLPGSRHAGKRVSSPVETVDIAPTVLEELGFPVPPEVQGKSLLAWMNGEDRQPPTFAHFETYFPFYRYGWSALTGVRNDRYKYIRAPEPELYDLQEDPGEERNIYGKNSELAAELEERLTRFEDYVREPDRAVDVPGSLDEETLEKLAALGYVGGFHSLPESKGLADPKNKVLLYNRIRLAEERYAEGELDGALIAINEVIREDPDVAQARQIRAQIRLARNEGGEAIEDCRAALATDPENKPVLFTLAHALRLQREYGESIAVYERLMSLDDRDYRPPLNLGRIYLEQGDVNTAVACLKLSIRLDPERSAMAHNLLGAAYLQTGRFEEAEPEIRSAIALRPWIKDAHYNLGLLRDRMGDAAGAARELRTEIDLHPDSYLAHFHLARVLEQLGDEEGKIEHLKEVIELKSDFANVYLMLAKTYLDLNRNLDQALRLTERGLELDPESEFAPFGHFLLADICLRLGDEDRYRIEREKGERLQKKLEAR